MIVYACNRSMKLPRKSSKRRKFVLKDVNVNVPTYRAKDYGEVRSLFNDIHAADRGKLDEEREGMLLLQRMMLGEL